MRSYDTGEGTVDEEVRPVDKYGFYHTVEFKHHNYVMMERYLKELTASYPNITRLYSIGFSVQGRELYVMEVTTNPGVHSSEKPEMKYVGNMHGNEVVGREMLLLLLRYLCENYGTDERVTRIVETVRLHVLPSMNPDGYEISKEGDVYGAKGRANAKGVDLNRNFPDHYEVNDVRSPEYFLTFTLHGFTIYLLSCYFHISIIYLISSNTLKRREHAIQLLLLYNCLG